MRIWRFRSGPPHGRRAKADPASSAHIAARIEQLVAADVCSAPAELAPDERAALSAYLHQVRALLALSAIVVCALKDMALIPACHAYYRRAFAVKATDPDDPNLDVVRRRAQQMVEAEPGAALYKQIERKDDAQFRSGLRDLVRALGEFLSRDIGVVEKATRKNFDEHAYFAANPDIEAAFLRGDIKSPYRHFLAHGLKEGRWQRRAAERKSNGLDLIYPLDFCRAEGSHHPVGRTISSMSATRDEILRPSVSTEPRIAHLAATETRDSADWLDLALSSGDGLTAFRQLTTVTRWTAIAPYVAALSDVDADVDNGVVYFDRDKAWGDSCFATLLTHGAAVRSREIVSIGDGFARIEMKEDAETLPVDGPVMLICSWATAGNHGHWLMNSLFSVYLMREAIGHGHLSVLCPKLSATQREHLVAIGVPDDRIVEAGARHVRCKSLLYPSPLSTSANIAPHSVTVSFLDFLREKFRTPASAQSPRLIYLSRQGFGSARSMDNEAELERRLAEKFNFTIIRPHDLSLSDQINIMSQARLIVGQFGAALWNTGFAPAGATLVEISTSNYVSNEYLYLSSLTSHRFVRIMADNDVSAFDGSRFEFMAPIETILATVGKLVEGEPDLSANAS